MDMRFSYFRKFKSYFIITLIIKFPNNYYNRNLCFTLFHIHIQNLLDERRNSRSKATLTAYANVKLPSWNMLFSENITDFRKC